MQHIAPTRVLLRRNRQFLQYAFFLFTFSVFLLILSGTLRTIPLVTRTSPDYTLYTVLFNALLFLGIALLVVSIGLAIRAWTWKSDNNLAKRVGDFLDQYLDSSYIYIRNVSKIGLGYVDAILVGPSGVLVFRVVDRQGNWLNEGNQWLKRNASAAPDAPENAWKVIPFFNPTEDCAKDIKALRQYLAKRDMGEVAVFGVVVFIGALPNVTVEHKNPSLPSCVIGELMHTLEPNYLAKIRLNDQTVRQIIKVLNKQELVI